jgi:hypothetical protein
MIITKYWHIFTIIQLLIIKYKDLYLPELALTPKLCSFVSEVLVVPPVTHQIYTTLFVPTFTSTVVEVSLYPIMWFLYYPHAELSI